MRASTGVRLLIVATIALLAVTGCSDDDDTSIDMVVPELSDGLLQVADAQLVVAATTGRWATTADELYRIDASLRDHAWPLFGPVPTEPDHVHVDVDGPLLYLGEVNPEGCSYLRLDLAALDERHDAFDAACRSARAQLYTER